VGAAPITILQENVESLPQPELLRKRQKAVGFSLKRSKKSRRHQLPSDYALLPRQRYAIGDIDM